MKYTAFVLSWVSILMPQILLGSPVIGNVSFTSSSSMYDKFEVTFNLTASYVNPYDPAQIDIYAEFWSPSNKCFKVNAFFYNEVIDCGCIPCPLCPTGWQEDQIISLSPMQSWKVRFTPNELGAWKFRITGIDNTGTGYNPSSTGFQNFTCSSVSTTASNKGFIKIANQRYLKFDDQTSFYPIGTSAPFFAHDAINKPGDALFTEGGTCVMKRWMDEMYNNGINFFRYEINFFYAMNIIGIDFRDGKNYYSYFNQLDSWQLDEIMDYAHQKGIYLNYMLFSHSDLGNLGYCKDKWKDYNPFNKNVTYKPLGLDIQGNCSTPFEFLTDANAIQIQKNLLRYIVARWGYSNNILTFELIDEVDQFNTFYTPGILQATQTANLINWHIDTKNYIKSIDPFNRPICTGYKWFDENLDFALNNTMDFIQGKIYTNQGPPHWWDNSHQSNPLNSDPFELEIFKISNRFNKKYFRPFYLVEFGYFEDNFVTLTNYDPTMYGLHGHLWSSLFSGAMGPSCFWTHDNITYNKPHAIKNFKGVSEYTKNLPLLSEKFEPINLMTTNLKLYYLKSINNDKFYGWIQDTNHDFLKLLQSSKPNVNAYLQNPQITSLSKPTLSSLANSINLTSVKKGTYKIDWFNTETGIKSLTQFVTVATSNVLSVTVPSNLLNNSKFGDLAFIIEYDCSNKWNSSVLNTSLPSNVSINSDIETDPTGSIFFVGTDNKVHIMYYNGAIWVEGVLNANAPANVRPGSDLARGNNDQVNFIGTDHRIHQYYWNPSTTTWIEALLCATPNSVKNGSSSLICDVNGYVYYIAQDNKIHNYWYDNINHVWAEGNLGGTVNVRPDSDLATDHQGNVFYIGADNKIYRHYYSGGWQNSLINPVALANVKSASPLTCDATGNIYYIANDGTNGRIHRYKKNASTGTWAEENFAPGTLTNTIKVGSDITVSSTSGSVFFIGVDNRLHHYYLNGTTWFEATLNTNDPTNAVKYIASDVNGNIFYNSNNVGGSGNRIFVEFYGCQSNF